MLQNTATCRAAIVPLRLTGRKVARERLQMELYTLTVSNENGNIIAYRPMRLELLASFVQELADEAAKRHAERRAIEERRVMKETLMSRALRELCQDSDTEIARQVMNMVDG